MPKKFAMIGSSATPIKKRYAMIGSSATPVKKEWAMIGSTPTLVFSAEEVLFPDQHSTWTSGTGGNDGGHTATISTSSISLYSGWGYEYGDYANASKAYAYTPVIDFSQYKKMTVTYSTLKTGSQYGTHATAKIGILNSTSVKVYNNNGCTEQGDNAWIWSQGYATSDSDISETKEYDLTNVNSKGRLWLLVYSYLTYVYMTVTKIVLE